MDNFSTFAARFGRSRELLKKQEYGVVRAVLPVLDALEKMKKVLQE